MQCCHLLWRSMEVTESSQATTHDKSRLSVFLWHLSRCMVLVTFVLLGVVFLPWIEPETLGLRSVVTICAMIAVLAIYIQFSDIVMRILPPLYRHLIIWTRLTIVAVALCVLWLLSDCAKANTGQHTVFGDLLYFMRCTVIGHDAG